MNIFTKLFKTNLHFSCAFRVLLITTVFIGENTNSQIQAQVIQKGAILEYNQSLGKKPMVGVEIKVSGAGSTISNSSGTFELLFTSAKAGNKINDINIRKDGYEIFNKDAVDQWNINPNKPFTILMCRTDLYKGYVDRYMQIASNSYAKQNNNEKNKIIKLKETSKLKEQVLSQKIESLEQFEERFISQQSEVANFFAQIDIESLSDPERRSMELVLSGEIDKAISVYEKNSYFVKYSSAIQKNDRSTAEKLFETLLRQRNLYALSGGMENEEKSIKLLEKIVSIDPTNNNAAFLYAKICFSLGKKIETINICNHLIEEYFEIGDTCRTIQTFNLLGCAFWGIEQMDSAKDCFHKALTICNNTVNKSFSLITEEIMLRINLSKLLLDIEAVDEAKNLLSSAKLLLDSNNNSPLTEKELLLLTELTNIQARILWKQGLIKQAKLENKKAESYSQQLAQRFKSDYNYSIWAETQSKYGRTLLLLDEFNEGEMYIREAEQKYIRLREHSPYLIRSQLNELFLSLSSLYEEKHNYNKSNSYLDSIIVHSCYAANPSLKFVQEDIANSYLKKSLNYLLLGEKDSSFQFVIMSDSIYQILYQQDPDRYGYYYSNELLAKGTILLSTNAASNEDICKLFDYSFEIMTDLEKKVPGRYSKELEINYFSKAISISNIDPNRSIDYLKKAVHTAEQSYKLSLGAKKSDYVNSVILYGEIFNKIEEYQTAFSFMKKVLPIAEYLFDMDSNRYIYQYGQLLHLLGESSLEMENFWDAESYLIQAKEILEQVSLYNSSNDVQHLLAKNNKYLGLMHYQTNNFNEASNSFYYSKLYYEKETEKHPELQSEYLEVLYCLGASLFSQQNYSEAEQITRFALELLPNNAKFSELLSIILKSQK